LIDGSQHGAIKGKKSEAGLFKVASYNLYICPEGAD
jgi:hypothetical protein